VVRIARRHESADHRVQRFQIQGFAGQHPFAVVHDPFLIPGIDGSFEQGALDLGAFPGFRKPHQVLFERADEIDTARSGLGERLVQAVVLVRRDGLIRGPGDREGRQKNDDESQPHYGDAAGLGLRMESAIWAARSRAMCR
jgi:hypothetical protein